jgi:HK97 family phage portal protein
MGVLSRLARQNERRDSTLKNPDRALIEALRGGIGTASGVMVSDEGALAYGAVLACVRVLSESVATLPCILYERTEQDGQAGKRRASRHPLYRILHTQPNPEMTSFEFWEMAIVHLLLWGNFYAEIVVDGQGEVSALWPIPPRLVTPRRLSTKRLVYDLEIPEDPRTFDAEWVFHVPSMRTNGLKGLSVVGQAREAIGLGMAAERYGAAVFGNGVVPGGVLEHPGGLSDGAYERLQATWKDRHQGLENAHRLAILEEGMKYSKIGVPPEDAQFLETRKFQRSEIAGMFRVPPHMIGDLDRATFSNIEHQSTEYVVYSVQPWLRRIEARALVSLLLRRDQDRYFAEFLVDGLLRGDSVSRNQAYSTARQWGWMSVNEIRQRENLNPVDGGDVFLQPMNMVEAGSEEGSGTDRTGRTGRMSWTGAIERRSADEIARVGQERQRMAGSFRRSIGDVAQRLVNREVNDVRNAARRLLKAERARSGDRPELGGRERRTVAEFETWVQEFYREHGHTAREYLLSTMTSAAELTVDSVERETGRRWPDDELESWVYNYTDSRCNVWVGDHRRAVIGATRAAQDAGDDPLPAVEAALDEIQTTAAERFSRDQGTRLINAVATTIYAYFVLRMIWYSFGESCDYCKQLNGREIGPSQFFLQMGDELVDAVGSALRMAGNVRHAPLHDGCDCQVVAA